jgi:hypothetical protein
MMAVYIRSFVARLGSLTLIAGTVASTAIASPPSSGPRREAVAPNNNRHPAGALDRGTLTLSRRSGIDPAAPNVIFPATPVVLNGDSAPRFRWQADKRHRVRLINITPGDIFAISLQTAKGPVSWVPAAKDGAPLPPSARAPRPATQTIAVGETYDFDIDVAPGRQNLWIEVRGTDGKWQAQGQVIAR